MKKHIKIIALTLLSVLTLNSCDEDKLIELNTNRNASTEILSAVGRNLFLLWSSVPNVDPESGYTASGNSQGLEYFSLPTTRNLGFNLSATF